MKHDSLYLLAFRASDGELYAEIFSCSDDLWKWLIDAVIDADENQADNAAAKARHLADDLSSRDELMQDHAERWDVSWSISQVDRETLGVIARVGNRV